MPPISLPACGITAVISTGGLLLAIFQPRGTFFPTVDVGSSAVHCGSSQFWVFLRVNKPHINEMDFIIDFLFRSLL